mmetsp:Transcript_36254/g.61826  ORF Transcript_36254/g.61826 Transcript_36254/m.61826 type:complete len:81 (-) Transcript_36254:320-562(-)
MEENGGSGCKQKRWRSWSGCKRRRRWRSFDAGGSTGGSACGRKQLASVKSEESRGAAVKESGSGEVVMRAVEKWRLAKIA